MGDFEKIKGMVSLEDFAAAHLKKSYGGLWCCPACNSGNHGAANSDGALSIYDNGTKWQCFSCKRGGDIFDLAGIVFNVEGEKEQLEAVASWAGIELDKPTGFKDKWSAFTASESVPKAPVSTGTDKETAAGEIAVKSHERGRKKEAAYVEACQSGIENPEAVSYLSARGLTVEEARAEGIGYDVRKKRIVIPWPGVPWYHTDRAISDEVKPKYLKPSKELVGNQPLYNPEAARAEAFFIVEGALDAIAVHLCGYEAVAIASNNITSNNLSELATGIKAQGKAGVAIIMLDSDEAGETGADGAGDALRAKCLPFIVSSIPAEGIKDPMEWYLKDKDALKAHLSEEYERATDMADELRDGAYQKALNLFNVKDPVTVAGDIFTLSECEEPTPTGINALDKVLDGGLRSGLYALGAISSMGKTTLSVQIADYIASHGRGVLFVTIEQSSREIVAKSLSRLTRTLNDGAWNVVTATEAVSPSKRANWNDSQNESFLTACEVYTKSIAPRLRILEGIKQPTTGDIEAVARIMKEHDGEPPVIFVDYLQLMAAPDRHDTDKQATDKNVMALRQIARDMKTPIWVISSLNRSSYSEGVTLDAWKESGSIEYSCDVLIGLQPQGMRETVNRATEGKLKRAAANKVARHKAGLERACELVILKNRNGATPENGIPLTFKPLSSLYVESASAYDDNTPII